MGLDHCPISAGGYPAFSGHHSYSFERQRFCSLTITFHLHSWNVLPFDRVNTTTYSSFNKLASLTLSLVTLFWRHSSIINDQLTYKKSEHAVNSLATVYLQIADELINTMTSSGH